MKTIASISEVERIFTAFKTAVSSTPALEVEYGKKLADVVDLLTLKDGVTKDLRQAYSNAEKKWALNYATEKDGCTKDNKHEKIKLYVQASSGYVRHSNNPDTKGKVTSWMSETFDKHTEAGTEPAAA